MKYLFLILFCGLLCCCNNESPDVGKPVDPDFLPGEIKPAASIDCFAGAYYRKAVSSKDKWRGINAKVVLPQVYVDPDRPNLAKPGDFYLDNFSIYLGGNANGQETDIGLTWEVIRLQNGNLSSNCVAFRPFWRTTTYDGHGIGWANADAQNPNYHFYPGDTLILSLILIEDKMVRFDVIGQGRIAHKHFSVDIECRGFTKLGSAEYKRVNAIDQTGNEGRPAQPTKAKTIGTEWLETNLLRLDGTEIITVPMHSRRYTDMRCPLEKHIQITASDEDRKIGAEIINILGTP